MPGRVDKEAWLGKIGEKEQETQVPTPLIPGGAFTGTSISPFALDEFFTRSIPTDGMNQGVISCVVTHLSGNSMVVSPTKVRLLIQQSNDLESWEDLSGSLLAFGDPGFQMSEPVSLGLTYVRVKVQLYNGDGHEPSSLARSALSADIHLSLSAP